ncbi:N-acetylmuramoyl-L-alanine amidase [Flagellimonas maritima]|uniref:N-acetylmuramoyl-L-alanine amidase n=1 Tax=Flagellimonas maritima TaxID=1383885 RepID=A0A2Z4LSW4_9FLAO|nr:N-acetylmuramoyl-L-alanine amidase [Allomuricauda aurantiaca]AWX44780.1 N-acetylmuramoyl-L-alanine amidase [Allomuricauda aurantiaca]
MNNLLVKVKMKLLPFIVLIWSMGMYGQSLIDGQNKKFTVVIDAGHGGHDSGTIDQSGRYEKNINLYVAKFVKLYLGKYAPNIRVILTRDKDVFLPLKRRPLYAKLSGADLFISLHCNHNPNSLAQGAEIYLQDTHRIEAEVNLQMATKFGLILDKNLEEKLNYKSRGILRSNLQVLRESISFVPSVLVELGFFSNNDESSYLNSKKGIKGISLSLTKSIIDHFGKI